MYNIIYSRTSTLCVFIYTRSGVRSMRIYERVLLSVYILIAPVYTRARTPPHGKASPRTPGPSGVARPTTRCRRNPARAARASKGIGAAAVAKLVFYPGLPQRPLLELRCISYTTACRMDRAILFVSRPVCGRGLCVHSVFLSFLFVYPNPYNSVYIRVHT